jgi:hypothetical protein
MKSQRNNASPVDGPLDSDPRIDHNALHYRELRALARWEKNLCEVYQKEKTRLLLLIDELDIKAETIPLSVAERAAKKEADECLAKL